MKKIAGLLCAAMVFTCSSMLLAEAANETTALASVSNETSTSTDLENMKPGDIVYIGDIAIQKAADDAEGPNPNLRSTSEGFSANLTGNKSLDKKLTVTKTYRYWFIYINNTGTTPIAVTIGNDEETQSRNYFKAPAGEQYYIWSTGAWPINDHVVSFSNGRGMKGTADARLCTTLQEALDHNF